MLETSSENKADNVQPNCTVFQGDGQGGKILQAYMYFCSHKAISVFHSPCCNCTLDCAASIA